jgi:hypothetical protein
VIWISALIGCLIGLAGAWLVVRRELGSKESICFWIGHTKPVYHSSKAFWWCGRCNLTLGLDREKWTPEAMAEHSDAMRRPDRN